RPAGLLRREVTRIITPGTVMDESLLPLRGSMYLAALARGEGRWGLAAADLSTGEFLVTEVAGEQWARLHQEITRLEPREILGSAEEGETLRQPLAPAPLTPAEGLPWQPR